MHNIYLFSRDPLKIKAIKTPRKYKKKPFKRDHQLRCGLYLDGRKKLVVLVKLFCDIQISRYRTLKVS